MAGLRSEWFMIVSEWHMHKFAWKFKNSRRLFTRLICASCKFNLHSVCMYNANMVIIRLRCVFNIFCKVPITCIVSFHIKYILYLYIYMYIELIVQNNRENSSIQKILIQLFYKSRLRFVARSNKFMEYFLYKGIIIFV